MTPSNSQVEPMSQSPMRSVGRPAQPDHVVLTAYGHGSLHAMLGAIWVESDQTQWKTVVSYDDLRSPESYKQQISTHCS